MHNRLSNVERAVALVLSLVWTIGGGTAMVLAWRSGEWAAAALAIFGVLYGVTWLRVVLLGRRLTWQESLHVGRHA
jgi:hypothetical protein